jgi:hypothetical protein
MVTKPSIGGEYSSSGGHQMTNLYIRVMELINRDEEARGSRSTR